MAKAKAKDEKKAKKSKKAETETFTVKDVASRLNVDAKKIRAIIRDHNVFGEQRGLRYSFDGPDDPKIEEIAEILEKSKEDRKGKDLKGRPAKKSKKAKAEAKEKAKARKAKAEEEEEEDLDESEDEDESEEEDDEEEDED
jgi:hypothetical protein